jgi:hypothetical protein
MTYSILQNKPLLISFILLISASIFFIATPQSLYPDLFPALVTGLGGLAAAAAMLLLPHFFLRIPRQTSLARAAAKRHSLIRLEQCLMFGLLLNMIGVFGLFSPDNPYDKFVHLFLQFMLVIAIASFIQSWLNVSESKAVGLAAMIMLSAIIGWEALEWASDLIFKTTSWGQSGQNAVVDTALDLAAGVLGIGIGARLKLRTLHFVPFKTRRLVLKSTAIS